VGRVPAFVHSDGGGAVRPSPYPSVGMTGPEVPVVRMTATAYRSILCAIGRRPPESGGLLIGPVAVGIVTHFHFDDSGVCTGGTYSPDHLTLGRLMRARWLPAGLDMKGVVHSHPASLDRLSLKDLEYIRRLLAANPDMDEFVAPIVLPGRFRFCPIVVSRLEPSVGRAARLELL
jgi:proteasome lid subunit RPN8/RPN11